VWRKKKKEGCPWMARCGPPAVVCQRPENNYRVLPQVPRNANHGHNTICVERLVSRSADGGTEHCCSFTPRWQCHRDADTAVGEAAMTKNVLERAVSYTFLMPAWLVYIFPTRGLLGGGIGCHQTVLPSLSLFLSLSHLVFPPKSTTRPHPLPTLPKHEGGNLLSNPNLRLIQSHHTSAAKADMPRARAIQRNPACNAVKRVFQCGHTTESCQHFPWCDQRDCSPIVLTITGKPPCPVCAYLRANWEKHYGPWRGGGASGATGATGATGDTGKVK
jgi:hypothetical protein